MLFHIFGIEIRKYFELGEIVQVECRETVAGKPDVNKIMPPKETELNEVIKVRVCDKRTVCFKYRAYCLSTIKRKNRE